MTETLQKLTLSDEELREKIKIHPTIKDESRQQKSVQFYGKKDMRVMDIPYPRITDPVCCTSIRCFHLFWGRLKVDVYMPQVRSEVINISNVLSPLQFDMK